ncbi:phosphotransferase [uncultured Tessaracoccus sp.]|uniref:phosphotransferase n=1 Tax=uncultured Tessaracoccus sp. TaxID=905023 RepID=UPI0025E70BA2|nr:phosphotransferase [uncultured Tessaracoccus sp.]
MTSPRRRDPLSDAIAAWANAHDYTPTTAPVTGPDGRTRAVLTRAGHPAVEAVAAPTSLLDEAERCSWLHGRFPAPAMADYVERPDASLVVTFPLAGVPADAPRWRDEPETAVQAIGAALGRLHALDASTCPFDPPGWLVDDVGDEVAVLHGAPLPHHVLLDDVGALAGIVGLGSLGPGDPWADLAVAAHGVREVFGPGWVDALVEALGLTRDDDRAEHYLRQWQASR